MVYNQNVIHITEDVGIILVVVIRSGLSLVPQVRVSFTGSVSHLVNERGKVGAERCSSTLQSIQGTHDDGVAACVRSKFRSKDGPNFFLARRGDIGIQHITGLHLKIIESSKY